MNSMSGFESFIADMELDMDWGSMPEVGESQNANITEFTRNAQKSEAATGYDDTGDARPKQSAFNASSNASYIMNLGADAFSMGCKFGLPTLLGWGLADDIQNSSL